MNVADERLVVNPYKYDRPEQRFKLEGEWVAWVMDPSRVAGVTGTGHDKGLPLILVPRGPEGDQRFAFVASEKAGTPPTLAGRAEPGMAEELRQPQ